MLSIEKKRIGPDSYGFDLQSIVNQKNEIISNRLKIKSSETLIQQYFQRTTYQNIKTVVMINKKVIIDD
jgi:hypothetical protein